MKRDLEESMFRNTVGQEEAGLQFHAIISENTDMPLVLLIHVPVIISFMSCRGAIHCV